MLTYLKYPLLIVVWMIALMSGILSIAREVYGLYSGTLPARSLFWSCVWIAFVVSAAILWAIEHKQFLSERAKNEIAPNIKITISRILSRGKLGQASIELFADLALTLIEPRQVKVKSYSIVVLHQGVQVPGITVHDLEEWEVWREDSRSGFLRLSCWPITHHLNQRGDQVNGWIHSHFDLNESQILEAELLVKVESEHGTCIGRIVGTQAMPMKGKGNMHRKAKLPS
jgi:hypothetical protein